MIHYSCDRCHRMINSESDVRYSVQIEVKALNDSVNQSDLAAEGYEDQLTELQAILENLEPDERADLAAQAYHSKQYDLCLECYRQYIQNPLSVETTAKLEFSDN